MFSPNYYIVLENKIIHNKYIFPNKDLLLEQPIKDLKLNTVQRAGMQASHSS